MGDHEDRAPLGLHLAHPLEALALERLVADRQHLVDEDDVGVDVDRQREPESRGHARRVVLDLHVDERTDLGEVDHVVEDAVHVDLGEAQDRAVEVHVLAARQVAVEAGAELEQRRHPPPGADRARRRPEGPGDALEQRGLARAVVPEQAGGLALGDLERHVPQRVEVLVRHAVEVDDPLLERLELLLVQLEVLGDLDDLDCRSHVQISWPKLSSRRPNSQSANQSSNTAPMPTRTRFRRYQRGLPGGTAPVTA